MIELADCHWPAVTEPYATALREAVAFGLARYPLAGIVAGGSILRGEAGPSSDWDLHLIHREPQRQRVQQRFNGVPAEIFVNPPAALRGVFSRRTCAAASADCAHVGHGPRRGG